MDLAMTEAREAILGRLVTASKPAGRAPAEQETNRETNRETNQPRAADAGDADQRQHNLADFSRALGAVRGEVHRVGADWPAVMATKLAAAGIERLWYGTESAHGAALRTGWPVPRTAHASAESAPELTAFAEPIEDCRADLFAARTAGFTSALAAIAETGTLILSPDATEPRSLSLVPEIHCALLESARIYATLEDWMASAGRRLDRRSMPTNLLLITGPSKSADIEQTLTFGVHGPKRLLVFVRA
jgi:L-lactate dehydrogenase complex protein LldG